MWVSVLQSDCKEWGEGLPKFQIPGPTLVLLSYSSGSELWKQRAEVLGINIKWVPLVACAPWSLKTTDLDQFSHEYNLCWWIIKHCSKNRNGGIVHFKSVSLLCCLKFLIFLFEKELTYDDFVNVHAIIIYLITLKSNDYLETWLLIIFTGIKLFLKFYSCTLLWNTLCIHSRVYVYKHFVEKFKNHTPAGLSSP